MRWMRRSLNPRQSQTELEAVLLLQRTWRGRLARRRAVKRQMLYLKRRANREKAATEAEMASRVQALWRGRRLRRQAYERRMLAATGFQTIWRLYHARQQYKALVVDYRSLRNGAAMTIQRRWRTRSERESFLLKIYARRRQLRLALHAQRLSRGFSARNLFRSTRSRRRISRESSVQGRVDYEALRRCFYEHELAKSLSHPIGSVRFVAQRCFLHACLPTAAAEENDAEFNYEKAAESAVLTPGSVPMPCWMAG